MSTRTHPNKEPLDTAWANRIVERYRKGEKLPKKSINDACEVLGIAAGTLIRSGCNRGFDRMRVLAGDLD